jgi:hypothetical protein
LDTMYLRKKISGGIRALLEMLLAGTGRDIIV